MDDLSTLREWTTSKIHLLHGPRRAGKTLKMTHSIVLCLIACYWINKLYAHLIGTKYLMKPLQVWTTYPDPVRCMYKPSNDGATWPGADKPVLLYTLPLNFHKLIAYDPEISWGFLKIDELNQRADRQQWQSGGQPLLMERLVQVGKSHLSLEATIQSLQWVNPRYMFQVDVTTGCRDAARTAWGKRNGLVPGDMTFLYAKDISGGETGYLFEENGKVYESMFYGKPVQPFYDTDRIQDPWEHYETLTVKRRSYVLDPNASEEEKEELDSYPEDVGILESVLSEYVKGGELAPKRSDFLKMCDARGMKMSKAEAIEYIEGSHNVEVYGSMGDKKLDFGNVTNLQVKPPRRKADRHERQRKAKK